MQATKKILAIVKRNGRIERFDREKIIRAIQKAGEATGEFDRTSAEKLTIRVVNLIH